MAYAYDDDNIFAKILRGEIPSTPIYETEMSLAFPDIAPQAPTHVLVVPKGKYVSYDHFAAEASEAEITDFIRAVGAVARQVGADTGEGGNGFRLIANAGPDANQEVPHFHVHILAGRFLGRLVDPE